MSDIEIGSVWVDRTGRETVIISIETDDKAGDIVNHRKKGCLGVDATRKEDFLNKYEPKTKIGAPKAVQILNEAVAIMAERGKSYDKSGGEAERSMPKIVAMFNALTGHELTPEQGWKFMCCLKLARSEQGEYREDNYLDGAAYMALAGEEASEAVDD